MYSLALIILLCRAPEQAAGINMGHIRGTHLNADAVSHTSNNEITNFEEFMQKHSRTYQSGTAEYDQRRALFEQRLVEITEHNSKVTRRWTASINKFADRTKDELKMLYGWNGAARPRGAHNSIELAQSYSNGTLDLSKWMPSHRDMLIADGYDDDAIASATKEDTQILHETTSTATKSQSRSHTKSEPKSALPECISWAFLDAMQKENIKDQAACGSCWAFAAAKALQANSEIYNAKRSFSVEQILSCTKNPRHCGGDGGCEGATSELAFEYVLGVGVETDESVPYIGKDEVCKAGKYQDKGPYSSALMMHDGSELHSITDAKAAKIGGGALGMTGWVKVKENSLESVKQALVKHGPLAVGVSAAYGWMFYSSGILAQDACPEDAVIDHAVTLVGYGKEDSDMYWHILNSWGADWGEGGYIRITMSENEGDYCGMDNKPQDGTACEGETDPVRVCGMCGILYDTAVPLFSGDGAAAKKKALAECS